MLVSVVMVMMMVFGMLSLSSASADLRLSQKAAAAQTTYYAVDTSATKLAGGCSQASKSAWTEAQTFVKDKKYLTSQPKTMLAGVSALIDAAKANPGANDAELTRGVYFCMLAEKLDAIKSDASIGMNSVTYKIDDAALAAGIQNGGTAVVVTVTASVTGGEKKNNNLDVTLTCAGPTDSAPAFKATTWKASVSGLEIDENQKIKVFGS